MILRRCGSSQHLAGCRKARPRCKGKRKLTEKHMVCNCGAYHFPHRNGSGFCGHPERMWELILKQG